MGTPLPGTCAPSWGANKPLVLECLYLVSAFLGCGGRRGLTGPCCLGDGLEGLRAGFGGNVSLRVDRWGYRVNLTGPLTTLTLRPRVCPPLPPAIPGKGVALTVANNEELVSDACKAPGPSPRVSAPCWSDLSNPVGPSFCKQANSGPERVPGSEGQPRSQAGGLRATLRARVFMEDVIYFTCVRL